MELVFTLGKLEIVLNLGILTGAVSGILLKALIVGLLTSVCAAVLGVPLVLKRYSMIGDGFRTWASVRWPLPPLWACRRIKKPW